MAHPRRNTNSRSSLEVQVIDSHRLQGLEALPDFTRKHRADQWEEGFSHLKRFCELRGHCRVSDAYRSDDGYPLGVWVSRQKGDMETMEVNRRQRLEGLPEWRWDGQSVRWDLGFSHLKQFYQTTGHCRVPKNYKCNDDYALGEWVHTQVAASFSKLWQAGRGTLFPSDGRGAFPISSSSLIGRVIALCRESTRPMLAIILVSG
jgi:hypothetical protein